VEYSANYLDSDALFKVLKDPGGPDLRPLCGRTGPAVRRADGGPVVAALKINGSVSEPGGRLIYQFDKSASISMTGEQIRGRQPDEIRFP